MAKKVAVIGAGVSGLAAIKCCLEEGLEPVCYELKSEVGGLWNYNPMMCVPGQSTVMDSTIINVGKETCCYSDFPMPKETSYYMHHTKVFEYLQMYANKFDLTKHIKFCVEVVEVKQCQNFSDNGRWRVEAKNIKTGDISIEEFDGVLVCNGHNACPHMPVFEGMDVFKGKQMHAQDFREPSGFKDQCVVVVGMSNTSCDVAVELSRFCRKVILSTRTGAWVISRIYKGKPVDLALLSRFHDDQPHIYTDWETERKLNSYFDHSLFNLKPKHRFSAQQVLINDHIQFDIVSGRVMIKPNIKRLTETGVIFDDDSVATDVDAIIYATGYELKFPFLSQKEFENPDEKLNLYKFVFPPDIEPATMAVIGCLEAVGANVPVVEIQARWAARVFSGNLRMPSKDIMWKDIHDMKRRNANSFANTRRYNTIVSWIPYLDEIAEILGCKPNFLRMMFTDPKLAYAAYFGPCTPAQFRLRGPGAWSGARDTVLGTWDRVNYPLQTRKIRNNSHENSWHVCIFMTIMLLAVVVYLVTHF